MIDAEALLLRSPLVSDGVAAEILAAWYAGWLPPEMAGDAEKITAAAVKKARRSLKAAEFRPDPGEEPDDDGLYWRTIRGHRIPFHEGQDFERTVNTYAPREPDRELEKTPEFEPARVDKNTAELKRAIEDAHDMSGRLSAARTGADRSLDAAVKDGDISMEQMFSIRPGGMISASTPEEYRKAVGGRMAEFRKLAEKSRHVAAALRELDGLVDDANEAQGKFETAEYFYRGTSIEELYKAAGGGIAPAERGETTVGTGLASLTMERGYAAYFGSLGEDDGAVVLWYDGDSVRGTGKAYPLKYSLDFKNDTPLYQAHERELRIPRGTKGAKLSKAEVPARTALRHAPLMRKLKKVGTELLVYRGRARD